MRWDLSRCAMHPVKVDPCNFVRSDRLYQAEWIELIEANANSAPHWVGVNVGSELHKK